MYIYSYIDKHVDLYPMDGSLCRWILRSIDKLIDR